MVQSQGECTIVACRLLCVTLLCTPFLPPSLPPSLLRGIPSRQAVVDILLIVMVHDSGSTFSVSR